MEVTNVRKEGRKEELKQNGTKILRKKGKGKHNKMK
jgi:hypothetical protein